MKSHHIRIYRRCYSLSSDLVIEQTLMRRVKTSSGLPRGRGIDELQVSIRLLTTPVTAEINRAMQEFTCVNYQISHQQKDLSLCRIQRNCQDAIEFLKFQIEFLKECDPLDINTVLINLNSDEVADESVNVFQTQAIGGSLIQHLISNIERRIWPLP